MSAGQSQEVITVNGAVLTPKAVAAIKSLQDVDGGERASSELLNCMDLLIGMASMGYVEWAEITPILSELSAARGLINALRGVDKKS